MERQFYFFRRNGIYYAELVTESGIRLLPKSTRTRNRDEAAMVVGGWLKNGFPLCQHQKARSVETVATLTGILRAVKKADLDTDGALQIVAALRERDLVSVKIADPGPGKEKLIHFLLRFWDPARSPHLKDKIAHGHKITQKYCTEAGHKIEKHWRPFFGDDITINDITRKDLREFSFALHKKELASATINNVMIIGTSALRWAHIERLIPTDPTENLITFTGNAKERDILTEMSITIR